jgi:hypothetical protein
MPQIINASCYNSDRICNLSFVPEVRGARWWYVVCPRLYQVRANLQTIFCCIVWRSLHLPTHELNNRAAAVLIIMVANQINEAKVEVSTNGFFKWTPMSLPQNNHWWQSLFHLWDKWECNKMSCWLIVACCCSLSRIQIRRSFFNWNCSTVSIN